MINEENVKQVYVKGDEGRDFTEEIGLCKVRETVLRGFAQCET